MIKNNNVDRTTPDVVKIVEMSSEGVHSTNLSRMAIGFVLKGRKLIYHNDTSVQVSEGEVFMLDAGVHYEENIGEGEPFEQIVFYVSAADLQRIIISLNSNYGVSCDSAHRCEACRRNNFVVCPPSAELYDFFMGVNQSFRRSDLRRNEIGGRIKLTELIYLIVAGEDGCLRRKIVAGADVVNGQFAKEIYNNVFNDVSIEMLARKTNRSLTSFKKEFRRQFEVDLDLLLGENPLYDSYEVTLDSAMSTREAVDGFVTAVESMEGVEYVAVPPVDVIEKMHVTITRVSIALIIFVGVLLFISMILLNNTIRLAIYSKRYLINTMKLVGATKWYIMRPLLASALKQGIVAGIIAGVMLAGVVYGAEIFTPEGIAMLDIREVGIVLGGLIGVGIIITVCFSAVAVNKFVNMKSNKIYLY